MKRIFLLNLLAAVFVILVVLIDAEGFVQLSRASVDEAQISTPIELLHPKHKLPARCFAYVGDVADTKSWKLPYLLSDGYPDLKRLPKAIQAVITNYRGANVARIPERQIPDVLTRLGFAAVKAGKMPFQDKRAALIYRQLEARLEKLGRLEEIKADASRAASRP